MISIIIPTLNRATSLQKTLESISVLQGDADFEVIVIDNGSADATKDVCAEFTSGRFTVKYILDDEPGLLTGRHRGALEAAGDILCFIDDDIDFSPSWLMNIAETCKDRPDVGLMTGPVLPRYEIDPPSWLSEFWYQFEGGRYCSWLSLIDLGLDVKEIDATLVWGLNFVIRKSLFFELRGFNPDTVPKQLQMFQGDGETGLSLKIASGMHTTIYHPGLLIYHRVPARRLTKNYFGQRAFFQGVCDSYTSLRRNGRLPSVAWQWLLRIKSMLRKLRSTEQSTTFLSSEANQIREYTNQQYKAGYAYHQEWFRKSAAVREWVLREDYLNYKVPII